MRVSVFYVYPCFTRIRIAFTCIRVLRVSVFYVYVCCFYVYPCFTCIRVAFTCSVGVLARAQTLLRRLTVVVLAGMALSRVTSLVSG